MAKLIFVQLESCHANSDGVAWYAYFEGEPTADETGVPAVFADESIREGGPLGWDGDDEYDTVPEEVPNPLSKHAGLRRYFVSPAV